MATVLDGVKLGCGIFIVLPLLLLGGCVVLFSSLAHLAPDVTPSAAVQSSQTSHAAKAFTGIRTIESLRQSSFLRKYAFRFVKTYPPSLKFPGYTYEYHSERLKGDLLVMIYPNDESRGQVELVTLAYALYRLPDKSILSTHAMDLVSTFEGINVGSAGYRTLQTNIATLANDKSSGQYVTHSFCRLFMLTEAS